MLVDWCIGNLSKWSHRRLFGSCTRVLICEKPSDFFCNIEKISQHSPEHCGRAWALIALSSYVAVFNLQFFLPGSSPMDANFARREGIVQKAFSKL